MKFDNSHARNLNSITVEDFLRSKIEGYAEDWGLPSDFDIYSIIINELDGISGRKIGIYSSQNSQLIGKKGIRVNQLTDDLEEKFGSPINFILSEICHRLIEMKSIPKLEEFWI